MHLCADTEGKWKRGLSHSTGGKTPPLEPVKSLVEQVIICLPGAEGWEDNSVGKVISERARGPVFDLQSPCLKRGMVVGAYITELLRDTGDPCSFLPSLFGEL